MKILRKISKDVKAISPLISALLLILVATGATTGVYLWLGVFQAETQGNIDQSSTDILASYLEGDLTISGSTTVYGFTECAVPSFEDKFDGVDVSYSGTSSGAGVDAIGQGLVDIGCASRAVKSTELSAYPNLVTWTVAYDAVVVVYKGDISGTDAVSGDTYNFTDGVDAKELRAAINDTTNNIFWDRNDASGTEELFVDKLLDLDYGTVEEAFANNALFAQADAGYAGNPELAAAMAGASDGTWCFMSFGYAKTVSGCSIADYGGETPSAGTIMEGDYAGARPINYITDGQPTADSIAAAYIAWCILPGNNAQFCDCSGYISIYEG
jgi:phosphate transport system substrate-binding protein